MIVRPTSRPLAIVIDLDQTLVDTRCLKAMRSQRRWSEVYAQIPACTLVPGAREFLDVAAPSIKIGVVTNSPAKYARLVLDSFALTHHVLIGYHDVTRRKPHPEPMLLALQRLGVEAKSAWSLGDNADDIISARSAGIPVVIGVLAASDDPDGLIASRPTYCLPDLSAISEWLK